jgi:hypothetical protein
MTTFNLEPSFSLIAYSLTGKDEIIRDLKAKKLTLNRLNGNIAETELYHQPKYLDCKVEEAKWVVYYDCRHEPHHELVKLFDVNNAEKIKRYAQADKLKDETHVYLKFKNVPTDAFEHLKNTLLVPHPTITYIIKTIRGWYIDQGQVARMTDPLVWAKKVNEQIEKDKSAAMGQLIDVISDHRFAEIMDRTYQVPLDNAFLQFEQKASEVKSIRLHRKDVPIAKVLENREIDSEHFLDYYLSDYLLIPPGEEEYRVALERFPQYVNYRPAFTVSCCSV